MIFQKTIDHIDQLCNQVDSMILEGKNSDKIITLHLREVTEQALRVSFKEIKHKMTSKYVIDFGVSALPGIASVFTNNEFLRKQTIDNNNKSNEIYKKTQNFEQKWLSSIPYIHEAGIDKLFRVLIINYKSGFDAALTYLREEIKIITPRPFKQ